MGQRPNRSLVELMDKRTFGCRKTKATAIRSRGPLCGLWMRSGHTALNSELKGLPKSHAHTPCSSSGDPRSSRRRKKSYGTTKRKKELGQIP